MQNLQLKSKFLMRSPEVWESLRPPFFHTNSVTVFFYIGLRAMVLMEPELPKLAQQQGVNGPQHALSHEE